jgi:hypothetical protein
VTSAQIKERRRSKARQQPFRFANRWQLLASVLAAVLCVSELAFQSTGLTSTTEGVAILLGCAMLGTGALMIPLQAPASKKLCAIGAYLLIASAFIPLLAVLYGDGTAAAKLGELQLVLVELAVVVLPATVLLYCLGQSAWHERKLSSQRPA